MKTVEKLQEGIDVFIQSQTEPFFQYFLLSEEKTDILLTSPVSEDDNIINVSATHGFTAVVDEFMVIMEGAKIAQFRVIDVVTNAIEIGGKSDLSFTVAAKVIRGLKNLNKNGVSALKEAFFRFYSPGGTIPIDLSYVVINMTHPAAADDSTFGDLAALATTPIYFRKINGSKRNLGTYISNQSFRNFGADVVYTAKAGSGAHSTAITFDLRKIFTKELRLDPRTLDYIVFGNPANLTALTSIHVSILGSLTTGE